MEKVSKAKLFAAAVGAMLMMLGNGVVANSMTYFITPVTEVLGCTKAQFSIYYTIITSCTAVMSLLMNQFLKKLGLRKAFIISSIGVTAGYLILSRASNLGMIYVGAGLIGVCQIFVVVPSVNVINAWFTKNHGLVTGFAMSATGFGGLIMGAIMPSMVAGIGWRAGYMTYAGIWLVISIAVNILVGETPLYQEKEGETAASGNQEKGGKEYQALLKTPSFWGLMATGFFASGVSMIAQHLSVHLEMRGLDIVTISAVMGIWSLMLGLFKIAEGYLYDRLPERFFVGATMFFGAVGYLALCGRGMAWLMLGVVGYARGAASNTVLYPLIMRRLYGKELASAAWGICYAAFMAGGAVDQAELIGSSDVMVLSLPTSKQVEEVVLGSEGILEKGKAGMLVIDLTSGDPEISRKLAARLQEKEIYFIDSPMSGGVQKAAAQTLTLMVGGDKEVFEKNREIFDTIGDPEHVYYLGPSGAGDTLKCANNFLSACCAVATTEALAVAAKAGIDPKMAVEVIDSSGGRSHATAYKYPKLMFPDKPWNFTVDLMRKDINLFNESAKTLKVPAFLSGTLYQLWSVPSAQGKGNEDCLNVFKMYEDWCGVKLCGIHEKE